jgi:Cu2+-exporting ATPase
VAIDAADVVLVRSRLTDVVTAVRLSRATLRVIHQNLFWAFVYNAVGIPLAAGVFVAALGWQLNPMFAAAAMSLSSFCVVTNALRLNLFKVPDEGHNTDDQPTSLPTPDERPAPNEERPRMQKTISIDGMMCGHCEMHVKKALEALDGVEQATASHDGGTAVVELSAPVSDEDLTAAVTDAGYTVTRIA